MTIQSRARTFQNRLLQITERLSFLAPALIRLTVGLVFIRTGWGKLQNLGDQTEFFASLHIPLPALNARIAAVTEFVGGVSVLVGLGARIAALPLSFVMLVAILTAKLGDVSGLVDFVGLEEWSYLVMFLVIAIRGPGALSLDAWFARRFERQSRDLPGARRQPEPSADSAA